MVSIGNAVIGRWGWEAVMVLELWLVACAAAALLVLGDLELIPLVFFGLMRRSDMANDNVKRFRVDLMGKAFRRGGVRIL